MRVAWVWGVCVVAGCWRPNPAFIGGVPLDTTGEATGTGASSGSSAPMSSGTDSTSTGESDGTTSPVGGTGTGSSSSSTTTTTTEGTTGGSDGSSGSTGAPDPGERCQMAAADDAPVYIEMAAKCEAATWTYTYPLNAAETLTTCPSDAKATGAVLPQVAPTGESGVKLGKSIEAAPPWIGDQGVIEGEYLAIDLTKAVHPCFVARVDNVGPTGELFPQVLARQVGEQDFTQIYPTQEMIDANQEMLPHGVLTPIALPIPEAFVGVKIDVRIAVLKTTGPAGERHAALWERPRLIEAGP